MICFGNLLRRRGGATAVEFALVAGLFLPLCLGIFDAGLLLWTKGSLQSVASLTARCAAISSANCPNAQTFAVTSAGIWVFPNIISNANVVQAPGACISHVSLMQVTITCQYWAGVVLPPPLNGKTLTVFAYFPSAC